jgi:AraC family transcriptional regulator, regulatory protein of adaptative response / DNA-3-methyladenine glycosylase II
MAMAKSVAISEQQSEPERRALYDALSAHDVRFDGHMYIGVTSTGIYCRPVCPVRVPRFENCTFHVHAASAEKAGFRPCLVCRPELAPGDAKVDAVSRLARLALRRIEDGALNELNVDQLADEFDVTARHLRRAMDAEFGITPIEFAQTQRLLHAKQLLTETDLSVTDVAFSAGFSSLRRFNALFKARYALAPRALRRKSADVNQLPEPARDAQTLSFRIDYRPPMNWSTLLAFLAQRAIPGVEAVVDDAYVRTVAVHERQGWIAVAPYRRHKRARQIHALTLTVSDSLQPVCVSLISHAKHMFDTRAPVAEIERQLARDSLLTDSIARHSGMRLPGAFDGFELLLRAILGQQVSVKGATTLAGRMAARFGQPLATPWSTLSYTSPTPERLAGATVASIAKIGLPQKRAETIRHAARACVTGQLTLLPGADPDVVCAQLVALPGIGEWTASYVAMRALAWPDAFPLGDLGIKKALGLTRAADIVARSEAWRPWRAYAAIYLWLSLGGG